MASSDTSRKRKRGPQVAFSRTVRPRQSSTAPSLDSSRTRSSGTLSEFALPQYRQHVQPHGQFQRSASAASSRVVGGHDRNLASRVSSSISPDEILRDGNDDTLNEVIMAVDVRNRGTVGCAYYVAREEKMYFMEDVKLGGVDIVEARKRHQLHFEST